MYSDAFPAVSPYAAGKLKFLFFEGKDKQTKAIPKKTAGKASKKTEARQSTVCSLHLFVFACGERERSQLSKVITTPPSYSSQLLTAAGRCKNTIQKATNPLKK